MAESTPQAVVVGIDGSQAAIQAAEWAIDEAVSREVPLRLLHIIPDDVEPAPFASVGNVRMEEEFGETALRVATAAVEAVGKPVKLETAMLQGDPVAALRAESRNAAMICLGSVGIGRFARALLGSTATELAEKANCPVAIIRTQRSEPKLDSALIVVAVNDSPGANDVVEYAMTEAKLRNAPVLAVGTIGPNSDDVSHQELDRRVERWSRRYPGVEIYACATRNDVADFLAAMDKTIQLAVIGSTDVDQVARLIGPHRHPILGHAECSVLVVRS